MPPPQEILKAINNYLFKKDPIIIFPYIEGGRIGQGENF